MLNQALRISATFGALLFLFSLSSAAQTDNVGPRVTLSPGGVVCLPAENVSNATGLVVFGGATDSNGNAGNVKWTVFGGPSSFPPPIVNGTKLYKVFGQSISTQADPNLVNGIVPKGSNTYMQACIHNVDNFTNPNPFTATFNLMQTVQ